MFEGQFNRASFEESRQSEVLRQFRWTDLVARLAATRELRDELSRQHEGDFRAFATVRRQGSEEGKPVVNHDGLSDRKGEVLSVVEAATNPAQGDREKE